MDKLPENWQVDLTLWRKEHGYHALTEARAKKWALERKYRKEASGGVAMARVKSDLRCCKYCSHRKVDIANLSYYCSNRQSDHYLENIIDDTLMHHCK